MALLHKKGSDVEEGENKPRPCAAAETSGFWHPDFPEENTASGKRNCRKPEKSRTKAAVSRQKSGSEDSAEAETFFHLLPPPLFEGRMLRQIGDQYLLVPENIRLPGSLRYLRTGLLLGTAKNGRFEPAQALAMTLGASDYPQVLDFSAQDERVVRYLKGETIDLLPEETGKKKGWVLICVDGFGIGWGKYAGSAIKNKYYPGWRLQ